MMFSSFNFKNNTFLYSFYIFLIFYFYINHILNNSFWNDELATILLSDPEKNFFKSFKLHQFDTAPPLYGFILYIFRKLTSANDTLIYIFNFICFLIGILFSFKILNKQFKFKELSIFYLILICSPGIFFYVNEVRPYIFLIVFSLIISSFSSFIIINKNQESYRFPLLSFTLLNIAICYTHYYGFFYSLINYFFLFCFFFNHTFKKKILFSFILTILFFFPWLSWVLFNEMNNFNDTNIGEDSILKETHLDNSIEYIRQQLWYIRNFLFSFGNDYILIIFLSFLILFEKSKIYKIFFDIKNNFHILIHVFNFIIFIFFSIIFSSILPIFAAKYFIVFFPGLFLALNFFLIKDSKLNFKVIIYCLIIFISFSWWQFNYKGEYESNWKKNSKIIASEKKCKNSKIFIYHDDPARVNFYNYYLDEKLNIELVNIYNRKNLKFSKEIFLSECPYKIWIERYPANIITNQVSLIREYLENDKNLDIKNIIEVNSYSYFFKITD